MELIKKWMANEPMPESQKRALQRKVGMARKALDVGKTVEEIAEILKVDEDTAKYYIAFIKAAEMSKTELMNKVYE